MARGEMTRDTDRDPWANIKLNLEISPDIRMMDIEKLFKEIQNVYMYWTRDLDTNYRYVIDGG